VLQVLYTKFSTALGLSGGRVAKCPSSAFDNDSSRNIDFHEFVPGIDAVSPCATTEQRAEFCFWICDIDGDGVVMRAELQTVVATTYNRINHQQLRWRH
jgi:Ca2+-binding EF-hand superfamily protein